MRTVEELRAFVREHSPEADRDENTTDDALIWFVAMQDAYELRESCTAKDLAHLLQRGTPEMHLDDVQVWLDQRYEDDEGDGDPEGEIVGMVREHFGFDRG